ncbi:MAG: hypothetical protein LUO94_02355 [Methylococcaceae bacterium]|nr:hypothetical protein [Methylococcaceae bacterium]
MALDAKIKSELSRKAALIGVEKKRAKHEERNADICLAFRYLSNDDTLCGSEKSAAFKVLLKPKYAGWFQSGENPLFFLARVHRLTKPGISYIVKKGSS